MAERQLELYEGTTDFDYYYGLAAIDAGELSKEIFALQRVLYRYPDFVAAELELARGYYLLGQNNLARDHFDRCSSKIRRIRS